MTTGTLSAREAGALPWVPGDAPGVRVRVLWSSRRSSAVVVLLEPGAALPVHLHPAIEHHAYVIDGRCRAGERDLGPGSYVHVPAGQPHDLLGLPPFGATVFYVLEGGAP
jgi:quercetin dioxygenase-like cupin family protein